MQSTCNRSYCQISTPSICPDLRIHGSPHLLDFFFLYILWCCGKSFWSLQSAHLNFVSVSKFKWFYLYFVRLTLFSKKKGRQRGRWWWHRCLWENWDRNEQLPSHTDTYRAAFLWLDFSVSTVLPLESSMGQILFLHPPQSVGEKKHSDAAALNCFKLSDSTAGFILFKSLNRFWVGQPINQE